MKRILSWGTLVSLLTVSPVVLALGLAEPRVESTLDAPLQARLPLTDIAGLDPSLIKVRLADAAAFDDADIPRTTLVESVQAAMESGSGGLAVVLTTRQAIHEPYLNLLLTLEWPGGQQRQEVTLLLDPPGYAQMPALQAGTARPLAAAPNQAQVVDAQPRTASAASQPRVARVDAAPDRIRVASGDTLWLLAERVRPDGVSVEQMMLALQQANPDAFPGGNINLLRAGVTLEVPSRQTILANVDDAGQRVQNQNRQWQAQRDDSQEASTTPVVAASGDASTTNAASGNDEQQASDEGASRLTLLNDAALGSLPADAAQAPPAAISEDTRERLGQLEVQLKNTRDALSQSREQRARLADEVAALRDELQGLREQLTALLATRQAAPQSQSVAAQTAPPAVQPQRVSVQSAEQGSWRWLSDNALLLGGAVIALLLAFWLVVRRRAQRHEDGIDAPVGYAPMGGDTAERSEPTVVTPGNSRVPREPAEVGPAVVPEPVPTAVASTSAGSPSDSAPQAENISEADIYLAYGRYDQARDRLAQGLAANPERHDLRLKLLTACVALGDQEAAEQEADYLGAHGNPQQRAEAHEILARLTVVEQSPDIDDANGSDSMAAADTRHASPADESPRQVPPLEPSPELPPELPTESYTEQLTLASEVAADTAHDTVSLAVMADASRADDDGDRIIDYQPPSLERESERPQPELGQPVIDLPDDPLGLDRPSPEDEERADEHDATSHEAQQRSGHAEQEATGWVVEEVAFDAFDLDNERSTARASSVPASLQLDRARQRLDHGERSAARDLLDPLLDEAETAVAEEARTLIERHGL